jgi:hypothetical protein
MPPKSGVKRAQSKPQEEPSTPPPVKKVKTSPPAAPKKKKQTIRLSKETDELDVAEVSKDELNKLKGLQADMERPGYEFKVTGVFNNQDQFARLSFFVTQKDIDDQVEIALNFDKDLSLERFPFAHNDFWDKNMLTVGLAPDYNPVIPAKGDLVVIHGKIHTFKPKKEQRKMKGGVVKFFQPPKRCSAVVTNMEIISDPDAVEEHSELVDDEAEEAEEEDDEE